MATTRFIAMHINKGKNIAQCIKNRIDYAINPDKTENGKYISSYGCNPENIQGEFLLSKSIYANKTGREQKNDVIAYQIRQSFKPGEVTPQKANDIGYKLAMKFTKGNYAFIVATHIDKSHIHNHIIFNSTSLDCNKKFRDFLGSGKAIRKISDYICIENGLSIIENPKKTKSNYGKWLGNKKQTSHSEKLRIKIDEALQQKPKNINEFFNIMKELGYEIKTGKHIAFKSSEQKKYIRLNSLGKGYTQQDIFNKIEGKTQYFNKNTYEKNINFIIDIQEKINEGKGKGYAHWAKIFNAKQISATLNYISENNIQNYDVLDEKVKKINESFNNISNEIKDREKRMNDINQLKKHIINYLKTKDIYNAYKQKNFSIKFYEEHKEELIINKSSKEFFDKYNIKKLPSIKSLQCKYMELLYENKKAYKQYHKLKKDMKELLIIKSNIDYILNGKCSKKELKKTEKEI